MYLTLFFHNVIIYELFFLSLEQRSNKQITQPRFTNPKSVQLAAKIKLMKMKGVAVGDKGIPQSERVFFNIVLPKSSNKKPEAMFFSKVKRHY